MASSLSQTVLFSILLLLSLHQACAKKTHLHFYFFQTNSGPNATAMTVVKAPNSDSESASNAFGTITVIDDILREGPDDNSTLIGRCQGLGAVVGKDGSREAMQNYVFTNGKYNGSSLAIYGMNEGTTIERPVIGGTGKFRLATGYSVAAPVLLSATKLIYEYNVYVWHKEMKDD